jgi:Flp pilus assembly protein TadB
MQDGFSLASPDPAAVAILAGMLALGALAVLVMDWLSARSPAMRQRARLQEVLSRGMLGAEAEEVDADRALFLAQRKGLRGRIAAWLADLSLGIGGPAKLRLLLAVVGLSAVAGVTLASAVLSAPAMVEAALGVAAGYIGFLAGAAELKRRWSVAFLDQLVEAVELMGRSVRSGFTPGAAIRIVGAEVGAPAGPVFTRIADEDELGLDLRLSLRRAARSINLPDFSFLAVALVLQRETGGQLADTLDGLHLMLRKRREARLKIQALTSEGRMSATILSLLPFVAGAGVAIASPDQFALLFQPGLGQTMLTIGGALLAIGVVVMRWMAAPRA